MGIGGINIGYGDGSLVKGSLEEQESALWIFDNLSNLKGAMFGDQNGDTFGFCLCVRGMVYRGEVVTL